MKAVDLSALMSGPGEEAPMDMEAPASADLSQYSDDELIAELEKRGFEIEDEAGEKEIEAPEMEGEEV
jgi:hypothetical protein